MKQREQWPASNPEVREVDSLVPYARNARKHSEEQVAKIAAAIQEWGWTNPVLVGEDGDIIAGHGRVLAAQRLGIQEVPVVIARGWTPAQKRAYILADNRLAEEAGWDRDVLSFELGELDSLGFDVTLTGFDSPVAGADEGVAKIDVPEGVNFVWGLIGVSIKHMGELQALIDAVAEIDGSIVEVSDDYVER